MTRALWAGSIEDGVRVRKPPGGQGARPPLLVAFFEEEEEPGAGLELRVRVASGDADQVRTATAGAGTVPTPAVGHFASTALAWRSAVRSPSARSHIATSLA